MVYHQDHSCHHVDDVDSLDPASPANRPDDGVLLEAIGAGLTSGLLPGSGAGHTLMIDSQEARYIHGTHADEQERLAGLNRLTNPQFIQFLALNTTETVLEVGSGLGILAVEVADRVP